MSRRAIAFALAIVVLLAGGITVWAVIEGQVYAGRVFRGVMVEGRDVGGLDASALVTRVRATADLTLSRPVVIRAGPHEFTRTAEAWGMRASVDRAVAAALAVGRTGSLSSQLWQRITLIRHPVEIPIVYTVDAAATRRAIAEMSATIVTEPVEAEVTVTNGRLVVTKPSRDGVVVAESASVNLVIAGLTRRDATIGLVVAVRRPVLSTEDAQRMTEPVASFTTRFGYNPDRIHNIGLAAGSLRGHLVPPGGVLSYNQVVGPRDPRRGYRKAPVLVNDILVPGDGGGVCQVSSTLFNAALLADMKVETRTNHSSPVPYLAAGRDATVNYGSIDLRLRNTSGQPLLIWSEVTSRTLTFTMFAPPRPGREVEIIVTDHTWLPAPTHTVTKDDPFLPVGETKIDPPKRGLRARTIRIVRENGQIVREEVVALNYYKPVPRTIRVGAKGALPEGDRRKPIRRASAP